jgi:transcriptional regulator with XRE-family HTH domain
MGSDELKKLMRELEDLCRIHGQQKQIAHAIGVSEQVLSNWIHGSRSPSLDSYFKIREYLSARRGE